MRLFVSFVLHGHLVLRPYKNTEVLAKRNSGDLLAAVKERKNRHFTAYQLTSKGIGSITRLKKSESRAFAFFATPILAYFHGFYIFLCF